MREIESERLREIESESERERKSERLRAIERESGRAGGGGRRTEVLKENKNPTLRMWGTRPPHFGYGE